MELQILCPPTLGSSTQKVLGRIWAPNLPKELSGATISAPGTGIINYLLPASALSTNTVKSLWCHPEVALWDCNPPGTLFSYQKEKNFSLSWIL